MDNQRSILKVAKVLVTAIFLPQSPSFCMMMEDYDTNTSGHLTKKTHDPMFPATSMPDSDWWHALWPDPKKTILSLGIKKEAIAIDLCCGDGYFTFPLAEMSSKVYGIELDADLLEQAKKEAESRNIINCQWIYGDAMKLSDLVGSQ